VLLTKPALVVRARRRAALHPLRLKLLRTPRRLRLRLLLRLLELRLVRRIVKLQLERAQPRSFLRLIQLVSAHSQGAAAGCC
jgi:hypothetical protein